MTDLSYANCRVCGTPKILPFPTAHPACPKCDRLACGKCGHIDLTGTAKQCVRCRHSFGG